MKNNLYRIETTGTIENPKMNGSAMLYCDSGIAFVKLHPVKLKAKPKCDIPEVATGRWIKQWCDNNMIGHEYEECSICGCSMLDTNQFWDSKFCPNCGARMDEKVEV